MKKCVICRKRLDGKKTKFCSTACKNKGLQGYFCQKRRGLSRKLALVLGAGAKCSVCGYSKNLAALVFHHKASKEKSFKLDMRSLSNRKISRVSSELRKCILLCSNCHAEMHHPELSLKKLS